MNLAVFGSDTYQLRATKIAYGCFRSFFRLAEYADRLYQAAEAYLSSKDHAEKKAQLVHNEKELAELGDLWNQFQRQGKTKRIKDGDGKETYAEQRVMDVHKELNRLHRDISLLRDEIKGLEARRVPYLVVRCAPAAFWLVLRREEVAGAGCVYIYICGAAASFTVCSVEEIGAVCACCRIRADFKSFASCSTVNCLY
jgi:hypothetical protein